MVLVVKPLRGNGEAANEADNKEIRRVQSEMRGTTFPELKPSARMSSNFGRVPATGERTWC